MTLAGLAFEALVCVLLLMAVIMCWRVDRRLRALRSGQDGLVGTITGLNDAVERARATLSALDRATRDGGESLREEVDRARKLADELRFLSGEAELSAERLTQRPRREAPQPQDDDPEATRSRRRLNALKALR
ncbi:MAG: hypothetical protein CMH91_12530 [Oceanicaulis sp.]|jgi:hypothetical protein|uniref:DUF6468 domain-containing protein n=1 Tax=unclassified Oceanicaulis TaxID=2632123 RepID=UPI000066D636|nr:MULTISPECIES: DUF6468 domain-containing protein [unclassified Oceanicaulis]EAP91477.1 hypothetical protein OA2633_04846 [Oceanicaulis sp. HTCC2633]MBC39870.1 hypothetical protein [Oceanicaulis sp.]MBG37068.1 hypothetical protein [Oceanicaulis sp.]HBU61728.1 hypothetical protein [Oceanicaulis sp.]|tara:strand:- start:205 stop:603 length:399 start_codon:yes stop_codon:yes gene_type:complete